MQRPFASPLQSMLLKLSLLPALAIGATALVAAPPATAEQAGIQATSSMVPTASKARRGASKRVARRAASSCGEYKYRDKSGACTDARSNRGAGGGGGGGE